MQGERRNMDLILLRIGLNFVPTTKQFLEPWNSNQLYTLRIFWVSSLSIRTFFIFLFPKNLLYKSIKILATKMKLSMS